MQTLVTNDPPTAARNAPEANVERAPRTPILIMGMGINLYGKERRVIRMVSRMPRLAPLFLISLWDLGDVAAELKKHALPWRKASFGYLGFARLWWTLKNISLMPLLFWNVVRARRQHGARLLLFVEVLSFCNALPVFLVWKLFGTVRIVFYLGDIGGGTRVQRGLLRLADRVADAIIVNSHAVKTGLEQLGLKRAPMHVVYNGVDCDEFRSATPVNRSRFRHWNPEDVVIGFVGQLKENKGIADFLEAARLTIRRVPTARFLVIGGCPQQTDYPERLKEAYADLADHVEFLSFVSKVTQFYRTMDVVVVASRHVDPAPNVNLEAMASGIPVVATDIGGSPELIVDGVTGLLVPPCQPEKIAAALCQLIADPDLRVRMGRAGQDRCRLMFDADANAQQLESLILQAAT